MSKTPGLYDLYVFHFCRECLIISPRGTYYFTFALARCNRISFSTALATWGIGYIHYSHLVSIQWYFIVVVIFRNNCLVEHHFIGFSCHLCVFLAKYFSNIFPIFLVYLPVKKIFTHFKFDFYMFLSGLLSHVHNSYF